MVYQNKTDIQPIFLQTKEELFKLLLEKTVTTPKRSQNNATISSKGIYYIFFIKTFHKLVLSSGRFLKFEYIIIKQLLDSAYT